MGMCEVIWLVDIQIEFLEKKYKNITDTVMLTKKHVPTRSKIL